MTWLRTSILLFGFAALFAIGCNALQLNKQPSVSVSAQIQRGEQLYNANCLVCHGGASGGTMMDYPPKHNANGHTWHHPDCQLKIVILNGSDEMTIMMRQMMNVPDTVARMPVWKYKLSNDDIDAILTFIKTWWSEDQRAFQAQVTRAQCS